MSNNEFLISVYLAEDIGKFAYFLFKTSDFKPAYL